MTKSAKPHRRQALPAPRRTAARLQVAALCWRISRKKGLRILLITSRDTGRWVVPKGWTMHNRTDPEAAAREAYEEAGVRGVVSNRSLGLYTYFKKFPRGRVIPCAVRVFSLEVSERLKVYPETGQRRAKWFTPQKAARKVAEPELRALIRGFDPRHDAPEAQAAPSLEPVE